MPSSELVDVTLSVPDPESSELETTMTSGPDGELSSKSCFTNPPREVVFRAAERDAFVARCDLCQFL